MYLVFDTYSEGFYQFENDAELKEHLIEGEISPEDILSGFPENGYEYIPEGQIVIIKGDFYIPRAKETVKEWDI
jgi:hypothetical protein